MADLRKLTFNVTFDGNEIAVKKMDTATDNLKKKGEQTQKAFKNLNKTMGEMGKAATDIGKGLTTKVSAPLIGVGAAAIHTVSGFDDAMSKVKAISGATANEFVDLREEAKRLGAETAFSASQAAEGMTVLASAGLSANDILRTTGDVLNLASASKINLDQAADVVTATMNQFGLSVKDANWIADVFIQTGNATSTEVLGLAESMKYAGGSAATMNMDIVQTNAILGIFGNNAIKGSQAGTTFTSMFNDISKNVKNGNIAIGESAVKVYDANGKMRDMASIMFDVDKATKGMTEAQRNQALQSVFGVEAMKGVNALLKTGQKEYQKIEKDIRNSDKAAEKASKTMEDNIAGAFRSMSSAIEGFMIDLGDVFKDDVKKLALFIGKLAGQFKKLSPETRKFIVQMGMVMAILPPIIWGAGKLVSGFTKLKSAASGAGGALKLLTTPTGWVVLGILAVIGVAILLVKHWDKVKKATSDLGKKFQDFFKITDEQVAHAKEIFKNLAKDVKEAFKEMGDAFKPIGGQLSDLGGQIMDVFNELKPVLMPIVKFLTSAFAIQMVFAIMKFVHTLKAIVGMVAGIIGGIIDIIRGNLMIFEGLITGDMDKIVEGMKTTWKGLGKILKSIWQGAIDFLTAPVDAVVDILDAKFGDKVKGIKEKWQSIKDFLKNPISGTVNLVQRIFGGGDEEEGGKKQKKKGSNFNGLWRVPFDGYETVLHRNEMVLTKGQADDYRTGKVQPQVSYVQSPTSTPQTSSNSFNINVDIPINIQGNPDEATTRELENRITQVVRNEFSNMFYKLNVMEG